MSTRKRRLLVGSFSSIVWPAVFVLIPAGITFTAARVYAESAAPMPDCDSGAVLDCADAAYASCSPAYPYGGPGICLPNYYCGSGTEQGPLCTRAVIFCAEVVDDCAGKPANALCNGSGRCEVLPNGCYAFDAGIGSPQDLHRCIATDAGPDSAPPPPPGADAGIDDCFGDCYRPTPADAGTNKTAPTDGSDGAGCNATPATTSLPLLGAPLALGVLFALRRKRARRAKIKA